MNLSTIYQKALNFENLTIEEGVFLYHHAATAELMEIGHQLRLIQKPDNIVTWQIDRNLNTTNVCVANCKFCNFYRKPGDVHAYITDIETYKRKIDETIKYGGDQLLLQGGHHPDLGLDFYVDLFKQLKILYPNIRLHALGPPEIAHICKLSNKSHHEVLSVLKAAGLDSLPGAGAEILNDRVRRLLAKGKCTGQEWLQIMEVAHQLHITTSATMMFGHIETIEERMQHLVWIRETQAKKPSSAKGFNAFIAWPFQDEGTLLKRMRNISNTVTGDEYIRMVAISRMMLPNIKNIQASWLTVGEQVAQMALYAGANDFGSIMIEENVVSVAGAPHRYTFKTIQNAIKKAGFQAQLRNQEYDFRELPTNIQEQVIDY
ncbi:MAG: CofH family radical SAM protein [Chitinophagales bacterium]|nr:CofH family radical SAM protein [Chitinophagales bacterium]